MAGGLSKEFRSLKGELLRDGKLFEDDEFPAVMRSIYPSGKPADMPRITWARPGDISEDPEFIIKGTTRFDFSQGQLGNCWFVAAAASLICTNRKLFERVCPSDQGFDKDSYAGIFRFNFWRYGKWKEVVVDDRLPITNVWGRGSKDKQLVFGYNSAQINEYWVALLEKAYAKLNGSYQAIDGGSIQDALIDMTGGMSEVIDLRNPRSLPTNFYELVDRTIAMNSMIGVSIPVSVDSTGNEQQRLNGLYEGHAYSVTGLLKVTVNSKDENIVRLRNPWGSGEWRGAWSDRSSEWKAFSEKDRQSIGLVVKDDGEFWMPFDEMVREFDEMGICHLTPDSLTEEVAVDTKKVPWKMTSYNDSWVKKVNAGGAGNPPNQDLYWINPQYKVELVTPDSDNNDGLCTLVASLMEKEKRSGQQVDLATGLDIFEMRPNVPTELLNAKNLDLRAMKIVKRTDMYAYKREVSHHLRVKPGKYVIIPSTFRPGMEGNFLLRIYTQKEAPSRVIDSSTGPASPEKPVQQKDIRLIFNKFAGTDEALDAKELSHVLNDYFEDDIEDDGFSVEAARSVIPKYDYDFSGLIAYAEVTKLIKDMDLWKSSFYHADVNKSGNVDIGELDTLLKLIGLNLSRRVLGATVRRYRGKTERLNFQDYIVCLCRILNMHSLFYDNVPMGKDKAEMTLDEWMYQAMYY